MKWMDDKTTNPLDANAALFDATLREFAAHFYKDASLNEILKSAGMNKGSFYYRFQDKLDLYLSLLLKIAGEKAVLFHEFETQTNNLGFFESFRQKAIIGLRFAKAQPLYHALFQRILEEENSIRETINACFGGVLENMMEQMIIQAKQNGELRADLPVQTAAFLVSIVMSKMDAIISPDFEEEKIMQSVDLLLGILKNGMIN